MNGQGHGQGMSSSGDQSGARGATRPAAAGAARSELSRIAEDMRTRVMNRLRMGKLSRRDPLRFATCIDPHGERLGFFHLYVPEGDRLTLEWMNSPAYLEEARKQHPIDACHLAIAMFHAHLLAEGEAERATTRARFLALAEHLLDRGVSERRAGRDCFWLPHVDQVEEYRTHHKPWAASMVQGWAAALFMRAHQLGGGDRFADAALRTTGLFFIPVADGGVRDQLPNGLVCYEKYAFPGQVRHVLNGFLSSLFGLWDLARATGDATARELFEAGVATVSDERTLRAYDLGYSTRYDLAGPAMATPAGVFYTWLHARQLAGLARITRSERLMPWAERWRDYVTRRRYTLRSSADCLLFRTRRLPTYAARYLGDRAPGDRAAGV
jgi:D-glucuronyl C5-epimerase C-terminus